MLDVDSLNPLARRTWTALIGARPEWAELFGTCGENDLELAIPAPAGRTLVISLFSPPKVGICGYGLALPLCVTPLTTNQKCSM
jgi:hypothetical protein